MPDPCMLNIDGVLIGVTSTDILLHLGREEISWYNQLHSLNYIFTVNIQIPCLVTKFDKIVFLKKNIECM